MRILTFNIREGAVGRGLAVLQSLRNAAPDVIVLQEVLDRANAWYFADALDMSMVFADSNARTRNIALLTRNTILAAEAFHPFPLLRTLLQVSLQVPRAPHINVFGLHLGMIHDLWRTYELSVIERQIAAYSAAHPAALTVLAGDFNATAPGDHVSLKKLSRLYAAIFAVQFRYSSRLAVRRMMRAGYVDCYRMCNPQSEGFTFPSNCPSARIDYFFASGRLTGSLRRCDVAQAEASEVTSDHLPLVAEFDF
ncbi:MAG: endonuclease/exonuclease/phosphatase family protein [Chloroflexi bacterium]|nr:endonuclease/exonuclease/phosphatase family protein [Chloroflexota bacterium]